MTDDAFNACIRDLDADRAEAARLLDARRREVYEKSPRIKEIDDILFATGLNISKLALGDPSADIAKLLSEMEKENARLNREKKALLKDCGFKQNYLTDIYKCKTCSDAGFVGNEQCRCLKQKLIQRRYGQSNLSNILQKENFDNFDLRFYSEEKDAFGISPRANIKNIYRVCMKFVSEFGVKPSNLLFYGATGLGKTFLCNAVAKDLLDNGKTVLYTTAPQLFKVFEEYRFHREDMEDAASSVDIIYESDLLIIDDLGTEFITSNSLTEFFSVVNARLLTNKSMIVSTNLSPNELESVYTERIISRLIGNFTMLKFFGQDIRLLKKYAK